MLKRKGIINIDLLIAYMLFNLTIIILIEFITNLLTPFGNEILILDLEKRTEAFSDITNKKIDLENIGLLCNISLHGLVKKQINYTIMGFDLPAVDYEYISPQDTQGSITIVRNELEFIILAGSNSASYNASLQFIISENIGITNISLEGSDNYTKITDDLGNNVVYINLSFGGSDSDEIRITTSSQTKEFITMKVNGFPTNYVFIGNTNFSDSCGNEIIGYQQSFFETYGVITNKGNSFPIIIEGELAWIEP